jgi:hypothetical protein
MTMEGLLKQIRIPPEYAHRWDSLPPDTTDLSVRLERWRVEVASPLRDLASYIAISGRLSTEEQSLLVVCVAQYVGNDPWVSQNVRPQAECTHLLCPSYSNETYTPERTDILENYVSPDMPLITHILSNKVRPVFQGHLHPKVNPSTGRALSRVAGGPLASQDLYTSQSWKESHPGISNVLLWVVDHIKVKAYHITPSACA